MFWEGGGGCLYDPDCTNAKRGKSEEGGWGGILVVHQFQGVKETFQGCFFPICLKFSRSVSGGGLPIPQNK